MRNATTTSSAFAALLAATFLTASATRAEPTIGSTAQSSIEVDDGKGGWKPYHAAVVPNGASVGDGKGGWRAVPEHRRGMGFGGLLGLGAAAIGSAFMEDSATRYRETCIYVGGCKATFIDDPGAGPIPPKVEIRKLAPKPRLKKPIFDKRSGWTYYLQEDRNTGEIYIQIEDANGADVHINGEIPLPGGGPLYPVR